MNTTKTCPDAVRLLLDAREASKALGICQKTLWANTRPRGSIPCVRIGKRVLYAVADLQRWIDAQKQDGGQEA
ncbi:MAG: helix-turn-helix domain-containing protein [Rhodopirellula sp.]|nr:helix-turn-helix domain-containing protein [Rhodopirellula sp.]